ncbi:MAG: hypothetical protein VYA17_08500 [Pseudomonadota bacterium]|nr:hypothetical protein [Pseudomonadota bacterium]
MARLDKRASQYFENTPDAFWRSFQAALVALPAYVALQLLSPEEKPMGTEIMRILLVETSSYVIGWFLFPLIMIGVIEAIGRSDRYFRFIVAWNWAIVVQVFCYLFVVIVAASGVLPASISAFIGFGIILAFFFYQGFIAYLILELRVPTACMIVLIDFVFAIILHQISVLLYAG